MPYCTQADIQNLTQEQTLVQLTDDVRGGAIDPAKVASAILTADEIIEGFLRGRYTVPLTVVPGMILSISRDLAIYELYSRRGEGGVPENVLKRAENARRMLVDIQKGVISLGVSTPDAQVGGIALVNKEDSDRDFGPETLAQF